MSKVSKVSKLTFFVSKLTFLTQILGSVLGGNFMSKVSKMSKLTFVCVKIDIFDMVFWGLIFACVKSVKFDTFNTKRVFSLLQKTTIVFYFLGS